jgi:hypothetical protein
MGSLQDNVMFMLKVAVAVLVINQIGPLRDIVGKNYFGS